MGHFNNNFKVADDIRLLGAVPEEEEEREVPIDKHMAKAMEERLLKGIEQEMLRDKQAIIRSFMKDSTGARRVSVCWCLIATQQTEPGRVGHASQQRKIVHRDVFDAVRCPFRSKAGRPHRSCLLPRRVVLGLLRCDVSVALHACRKFAACLARLDVGVGRNMVAWHEVAAEGGDGGAVLVWGCPEMQRGSGSSRAVTVCLLLCAESYMGGQSAMPGMAGMGGMTGMGGMPSMQGAGGGASGGGAAAQSFMQMQLMQQQNMMALQQMMMSMNMRPQGTEMGSMMGGMNSQMGYPQHQGSVMTGGNPSMMGQQPMMSMPMQVRPCGHR